mmetsp:Transcript_37263/g.68763  ORF Transcript_37263/g.68763 Transcript_37263/m.68763 type:complete len:83 (-) Transcript_37263:2072-2320(-)
MESYVHHACTIFILHSRQAADIPYASVSSSPTSTNFPGSPVLNGPNIEEKISYERVYDGAMLSTPEDGIHPSENGKPGSSSA